MPYRRTIHAYQQRVVDWLLYCFGTEIASDKTERSHRFLEEALELVQSAGTTKSEVLQLVEYVYGRPVGELPQEVGGTIVTLVSMCQAFGQSLEQCADDKLARVWTKVDKIREKHAGKPKF
jgi:hypothetical protein